jgi:4-amino-4-deoxy-L-arabinose transferase-like glycosyltransferase
VAFVAAGVVAGLTLLGVWNPYHVVLVGDWLMHPITGPAIVISLVLLGVGLRLGRSRVVVGAAIALTLFVLLGLIAAAAVLAMFPVHEEGRIRVSNAPLDVAVQDVVVERGSGLIRQRSDPGIAEVDYWDRPDTATMTGPNTLEVAWDSGTHVLMQINPTTLAVTSARCWSVDRPEPVDCQQS